MVGVRPCGHSDRSRDDTARFCTFPCRDRKVDREVSHSGSPVFAGRRHGPYEIALYKRVSLNSVILLGGADSVHAVPAGLSSDAKCNTPRRFDIGKVVQDLKECCHAILFASVGGRKRLDRRFAGRGAVDGGDCPGARSGESHHLQELRRNALPSGGYSPLHAAGAYQLRRRREAILEREAALRLFVGDRLAEGWTPEQISGWLKSGNEPRLRAIGCETIYGFIYRTGAL
jgi:hypothetical protein